MFGLWLFTQARSWVRDDLFESSALVIRYFRRWWTSCSWKCFSVTAPEVWNSRLVFSLNFSFWSSCLVMLSLKTRNITEISFSLSTNGFWFVHPFKVLFDKLFSWSGSEWNTRFLSSLASHGTDAHKRPPCLHVCPFLHPEELLTMELLDNLTVSKTVLTFANWIVFLWVFGLVLSSCYEIVGTSPCFWHLHCSAMQFENWDDEP